MTDVSSVFVDSNILIYAAFEDYKVGLHRECLAQLERYHAEGTALFINGQVLREFWAQATYLKSGGEQRPIEWVIERIAWFRDLVNEVDETEEVREQLLLLLEKHSIRAQDVHDANIVATMLAYGIDTVYSNDGDFDRYVENEKISFVKPRVSAT